METGTGKQDKNTETDNEAWLQKKFEEVLYFRRA